MIRDDWNVARICLQIIAEQGPGMAYAKEQALEDAALRATVKALGG